MKKERVEAFSDGVFAIVITLLVLDIKLPEIKYDNLSEALFALIPNIASYVLSFFVIGLYWIGHHLYLDKLKQIDGTFLFYNLLLLLFISMLPFPTSILGKFPLKHLSLTFYGANLLLTNIISFLLLRHIVKNPHLIQDKHQPEFSRNIFRKYQIPLFLGFNLIYILSILISSHFPKTSYALDVLVIVFGYTIFIRRMNKTIEERKTKC